jgi:serine/threonine protein kinase
MQAVRHPNIVRLYDVIETEKYIGIVLEYASGSFDRLILRVVQWIADLPHLAFNKVENCSIIFWLIVI